MRSLLESTAQRALAYLDELPTRRVFPDQTALEQLNRLDVEFPYNLTPSEEVIQLLQEAGAPATVATAGGRYFGFVTGATLPVALAAGWLVGAWDQNSALAIMSPLAAKLEAVAGGWLLEALHLPKGSAVGFVTGATMANFAALAAARHAVLRKQGWDVEAEGLFGAPEIKVVVGNEVHVSLLKALAMLGIGSKRVVRVPADEQGRMRSEALPQLDDLTILCLQAGNVNTGAFDPLSACCEQARAAGAWVHIDGAFGLWAAASPQFAHLLEGAELADSWATDLHKWLNVSYDSGLVICRDPKDLGAAMTFNAAYLHQTIRHEPCHFTPEMSKRARATEVWAALYHLGGSGLAAMIDCCCGHARRFAEGLEKAGFEVLNKVVLNQVLVSFGDHQKNEQVIRAIQAEGTCWCGSTVWQGKLAMRISVSSWATTVEDVERSLDAMIRMAEKF